MKTFLLAGVSVLAMTAVATSAGATPYNFTGDIVDFTVTDTGTYTLSPMARKAVRAAATPPGAAVSARKSAATSS